MGVVLLLALIWAVVLVPPALRSHAARKEAFVLSFGGQVAPPTVRRTAATRSPRVQRRRRIAGGLLVAMAATLAVGLLPTFRVLLVVHLFLVDSFLAYIGLLAHMAQKAARAGVVVPEVAVAPVEAPARVRRRWRPGVVPGPAIVPG